MRLSFYYNQGDKSKPYDTKDFVSEKNQIRSYPCNKADSKQSFALLLKEQLGDAEAFTEDIKKETNKYLGTLFFQKQKLFNCIDNEMKEDDTNRKLLNKISFLYYHK